MNPNRLEQEEFDETERLPPTGDGYPACHLDNILGSNETRTPRMSCFLRTGICKVMDAGGRGSKQFQEGSYLRLVDFCITQL